ncbi:MAG TPA: hypothetical protein VJC07_01505 [Candidatus Nanoarchaeia archaeon]|nr:hypothetical protein [Candidatus Nanoarchaeia archaeon]
MKIKLKLARFLINKPDKKSMRNKLSIWILSITIFAFLFNLAWEVPHSLLYKTTTEMSQQEFVPRILEAAAGDVIMVLLVFLVISLVNLSFAWSITKKRNAMLSIILGVAIAVIFEIYAQATGRFSYLPIMPLIPFTTIGLTPVLQMIFTPLATFWVAERINAY